MVGFVATATTDIDAAPAEVWNALTDPDQIQQYMFGSVVETDWEQGSPIVWKGEFQGRAYEDKGEVVAVVPEQRLAVTHFSPLSGMEDLPENYHTLTYELAGDEGGTRLSLSQDNNASEEAAEHSRANWEMMLGALKDVVERR